MPPPISPEQALVRIYAQAARRLRAQIRAALASGNIGTAVYRSRQLEAVQRELRALDQRTRRLSIDIARQAYVRGAIAVDVATGTEVAAGFRFGTQAHRLAVAIGAQNIAGRARSAAALVGRRTDDAFRRIGLEETTRGVGAGEERRLVGRAIERRLIDEGVTDALTGFVDARGARWQLDTYAEMVARTTTRELVTAGTRARMQETAQDIITISSHSPTCEICAGYDGNTYSMNGQTPGLDVIDQLPPFHPNCLHVVTPGEGNADAFIAALRATPTDRLDAALGVA